MSQIYSTPLTFKVTLNTPVSLGLLNYQVTIGEMYQIWDIQWYRDIQPLFSVLCRQHIVVTEWRPNRWRLSMSYSLPHKGCNAQFYWFFSTRRRRRSSNFAAIFEFLHGLSKNFWKWPQNTVFKIYPPWCEYRLNVVWHRI